MRLGVESAIVEGVLVPGDVAISNGTVSDVALDKRSGRGIAVPGFVDLQVNGFGGVDFATADADGYRRAGESLLESGVTAYQPTFITAPESDLVAALNAIPSAQTGPRILGAHL
jgi:N-acetylglucosamine-6-phosphate deacetylase